MLTVDYPDDKHLTPDRYEFGIQGPAVINSSPTLQSLSITPAAGARFVSTISFSQHSQAVQAKREAFALKLRGQQKLLTTWHLHRPEPRGTLRGTPTMGATAAKGAITATIACTTGETLLAGDMLMLGTQTVMVMADAVAVSSSMSISFECPLRAAVNSGTAVVWDRPRITWVSTTPEVYVPYVGGAGDRFALSFVEAF